MPAEMREESEKVSASRKEIVTRIELPCDLFEAFDFSPDTPERVGHLTSLRIDTLQFDADLELEDPLAPRERRKYNKVVGAIADLTWDGEPLSPMTIKFRPSHKNRAKLHELILKTTTGEDATERQYKPVELGFTIYGYDQQNYREQCSFFEEFTTGETPIKGNFPLGDSDALRMEKSEFGKETAGVFVLTIHPTSEVQHITFALDKTRRFIKEWGQQADTAEALEAVAAEDAEFEDGAVEIEDEEDEEIGFGRGPSRTRARAGRAERADREEDEAGGEGEAGATIEALVARIAALEGAVEELKSRLEGGGAGGAAGTAGGSGSGAGGRRR